MYMDYNTIDDDTMTASRGYLISRQREQLLQQYKKEKSKYQDCDRYAYDNNEYYQNVYIENVVYQSKLLQQQQHQQQLELQQQLLDGYTYEQLLSSSTLKPVVSQKQKSINELKESLYNNKQIIDELRKYEYLNQIETNKNNSDSGRHQNTYKSTNNQYYLPPSTTVIKKNLNKSYYYNPQITVNGYSKRDSNIYEKSVRKMQPEEIIIERSQLVANDTSNVSNDSESGGHGHHNAGNRETGGGSSGWQLHQSSHSTQIVAALAVSLGPLAAGLGKGYASPALASLQDSMHLSHRSNYTFSISDQEASWVASLSLLGALFGGMFGGILMQYGRKRILALMSLPFSASWILTVFAQSVETMFFTAFIGGFCCSIVSSVVQVYISEIASPDIRGFLSAIQKIAGHFGILISYLLGAVLDWRQLAMLVSVAPMMLFVTVIYIPETPSFLVLRGRDEEAYRALQWLRPHKNVEIELETIRSNIRLSKTNLGHQHLSTATINGGSCNKTMTNNGAAAMATMPSATQQQQQQQRSTTATKLKNFTTQIGVATQTAIQGLYLRIRDLSFETIYNNIKALVRNARLVKPVTITCGLMIFQRLTGANSFGFYAVNIFSKTFANMSPHGGAIAVGFVQLLAAMLSGLLIDTVGRIPLLITSSVFMTLALASFGSYAYYEQTNKEIAAAALEFDGGAVGVSSDWIPLLCVLVFTVAFSLGISPISWLLVGELFPLEYRGIGSSIATSFSYFCAFIGVKTFVDLQELLGLYGTFWLYACISCVGLFFVVMIVPETKGRDLDEMDPRFVRTLTINR